MSTLKEKTDFIISSYRGYIRHGGFSSQTPLSYNLVANILFVEMQGSLAEKYENAAFDNLIKLFGRVGLQ